MNFKIIIFLLISGCGVKSAPISPPEKAIDSYIRSYTNAPDIINNEVKTENKK